jgi:hypothetical protein
MVALYIYQGLSWDFMLMGQRPINIKSKGQKMDLTELKHLQRLIMRPILLTVQVEKYANINILSFKK